MFIYLSLMAEAFFGYLLPWGNMSYWGAQVIVSLFGAVPVIGNELAEWIRGDFYISDITLNRFFAFHVIAVPLMLVLLVVVHIMALHEVGSNNPDGIEIKEHKGPDGKPIDGVAFHPYHTSKDLVIIIVFLILFSAVVFFAPDMGGYFLEHANFEPADPLRTPAHIAPVWYFTPFYAILRAIPNELLGVALMGLAVLLLFFLPWLDRCRVKSIRYRSWVFKSRADDVCDHVHSARLPRLAAAEHNRGAVVAAFHDPVFRVLLVHAVLHAYRENQAGAGEGHVVRNAVIAFVLGVGLAGSAVAQHEAALDEANNNVANTASLQRGAKYFVNYCLGCHSAKYVRYNRLGQDLQLSEQQLTRQLDVHGRASRSTRWELRCGPKMRRGGSASRRPILSLIARSRGTDYIYTYLRSFYAAPERPTGVDNVVLPGTSMPHVLWQLQGTQRAVFGTDEHNGAKYSSGSRSARPGELGVEEFDNVVRDIVNFLDYIGEPIKRQRQQLGIRVIGFLLVFLLIAYMLKKEIWKDVK